MASILSQTQSLDTSNILGSTQNDCHFTDKCIFLHGNCCIFLEIPFKCENKLDNLVNDVFQIFFLNGNFCSLYSNYFFQMVD